MPSLQERLGDPNINLVSLDSGHVVVERVARLIEVIHETWPDRVEVRWMPGNIKEGENKFVLIEKLPNGEEYPIFWVKDESEFTGEVLERLILADNSQGDVYNRMQARNKAARLIQKNVAAEQMAEAADIAKHVMKSPLNKYVVNKDITIRDFGNKLRR